MLGRVQRSVCPWSRYTRAIVRRLREHPPPKFYDLGVDHHCPVVAGDGDAVVAVAHEVRFADLVEAHSGQLDTLVVRAIYPSPPLAHAPLLG